MLRMENLYRLRINEPTRENNSCLSVRIFVCFGKFECNVLVISLTTHISSAKLVVFRSIYTESRDCDARCGS